MYFNIAYNNLPYILDAIVTRELIPTIIKNLTPIDNNIIPILDNEYFEDDMVGRFVEFVKICFGEKYLEYVQ